MHSGSWKLAKEEGNRSKYMSEVRFLRTTGAEGGASLREGEDGRGLGGSGGSTYL